MKSSGVEWIGEIPEDWDVTRSKNIFTQRSSRENDVEEQLAATQQHGMYPQKLLEGVVQVKEDTDLQQFKTVHKNDYVISLRSFQGGFEMSDYEGVCSPAYQVFYNTIPISYRYYKYLFKSDGFISKMNSLTVGIREGKNIQYKDFSNSPIIIPPKSTQQRIASYLDKKCSKIEETIQNKQQVIEKLKTYKQSLITEAVTGKIKIQNGKVCGKYQSYKESGVEWIGKIPSEWEVKKLKYIADSFSKGSGITKEEIVINGDIPCVRYGELYTKYDYHFTKCQTRTNLKKIETPKYFSHGDVLFTCTGELVEEIGKSIAYLGNEKCLAGGDIIVLKHSQDPMFMGFALDSKYVQGQKSFGKTKLKVVHISSGEIARLLIVLPPKEEQKEIADYLDKKCTAIDTAIEQKQNLIEKLTEYKKSLIYECVTGKKGNLQ